MLLTLATLALLLGIIEGPERGWGDGLVIGGFVCAAALFAAWALIELRSRHPLLDPPPPFPSPATTPRLSCSLRPAPPARHQDSALDGAPKPLARTCAGSFQHEGLVGDQPAVHAGVLPRLARPGRNFPMTRWEIAVGPRLHPA